jgi:hypothetical protein
LTVLSPTQAPQGPLETPIHPMPLRGASYSLMCAYWQEALLLEG